MSDYVNALRLISSIQPTSPLPGKMGMRKTILLAPKDVVFKKNYKNGAITNETTAINFTTIFNAGPDVSLKGSPTVSPEIAAL